MMDSEETLPLSSDTPSCNLPNALPNAVPVPILITVDSVNHECRRCKKMFTPSLNANKNTAQYYRCPECLSLKETFRDVVYSCSVC